MELMAGENHNVMPDLSNSEISNRVLSTTNSIYTATPGITMKQQALFHYPGYRNPLHDR